MAKPKVFIASSGKAVKYATAVKSHISEVCDAYVWKYLPSYLAKTLIEWILKLPERFDFGIFIFSNDDTVTLNGIQYVVVRDNVLFELGLFAGKLGFDRCIILRPDVDNFHLPSDLQGILEKKFEVPEGEDYIKSALDEVCEDIKLEINQRWEYIAEEQRKQAMPERVAAICYRKNDANGLYEFLLVKSKDSIRWGFPKKPFEKTETRKPIEVAIEVAAIEGGVQVREIAKAPLFQPFPYKKEGNENKEVRYTPFLLEVEKSVELTNATKKRESKFCTLGEVFNELRSGRNDAESTKSLEKVICQCYEFLLR